MNTRSLFFLKEAMMMIIPGRKDIHDLRVTAYQVLTKVAAGSAPPVGTFSASFLGTQC